MTFPSKIVYPLPPPTTNCLTSAQRAQLIRSTKKLGRILGTTPHLIDPSTPDTLGPLHIQLPFNDVEDSATLSGSPTASTSSCSSTMSMACSYDPVLSRSGSIRSTNKRSGSLRSTKSTTSSDSWRSRKPPLLHLATSSPLGTISSSPSMNVSSVYSNSSSSFTDEYEFTHEFTIRPHRILSAHDSPTTPSFTILSEKSDRLNKMERLRKKLGNEVPIDLVFPREEEATDVSPLVNFGDEVPIDIVLPREAEATNVPPPVNFGDEAPIDIVSPREAEATSVPPSVFEEKKLPILPVIPGSRKVTRITSTRDSISFDSPHPAPRKTVPLKTSSLATPLPATPDDIRHCREQRHRVKGHSKVNASLDMRKPKARLCVIVESPSDHGSGCSEEFGVGRYRTVLKSEWYMSDDDEAEVRYWSTRKGYDGWAERLGNGESGRWSYRKRPMTP
ncbi:hypothetical protein L208DRAFT_1462405 [Tricholoma matsutake]|nr:hypothetical protein L208DRAFT_1462405 [Tricholoma matsutake 945]